MKQIDKFESAVKRVLTMDEIDKVRGESSLYNSPQLISAGLEAIEAGIACISRKDFSEGDDALYESAVYFFNAGFLAGKEQIT